MSVVRVNQLWPSDLKQEVQTHVGTRGMTAFTLAAIREKLEREKEQPKKEKTEERIAAEEAHQTAVDNLENLQAVERQMDADDAERDESAVAATFTARVGGDEAQAIELPPAALNPIPATVVETVESITEEAVAQECDICKTVLDEERFCWLCGQYR